MYCIHIWTNKSNKPTMTVILKRASTKLKKTKQNSLTLIDADDDTDADADTEARVSAMSSLYFCTAERMFRFGF